MAIIDERGALFGRFNVIDATVALFVVVLVPMGYVAYRAFRIPPPIIASVTPATLPADAPRRIRVTGEHFRPYLNAFVSKTGEPFSLIDRLPDTQQAIFLIETPSVVELKLPNVTPGTYDLYLYDEAREVARRTSAFMVQPGPRAPDGPAPDVKDAATLEIAVRFEVDNDFALLAKVGDRDLNQPEVGVAAATPAVLVSLRKLPGPDSDLNFRLADGARLAVSTPAPRTRLEGVVRLGVGRNHGVWMYPGPQRIRAGETFSFATASYVIHGLITRVTVLSRTVAADDPAPRGR